MKLLRWVKILLVLTVGVWGLIGTVGNLSGLSEVYDAVRHVTTMTGIPEDVGPPWRTDNPLVVWIGVAAIVLGKIAALAGGGIGGVTMLRNVNSSSDKFRKSKTWAVAGCGAAFALMFFSFTIMAESAFFMFFSPQYVGAGELAFRLGGSLALVALFVAQAEPD